MRWREGVFAKLFATSRTAPGFGYLRPLDAGLQRSTTSGFDQVTCSRDGQSLGALDCAVSFPLVVLGPWHTCRHCSRSLCTYVPNPCGWLAVLPSGGSSGAKTPILNPKDRYQRETPPIGRLLRFDCRLRAWARQCPAYYSPAWSGTWLASQASRKSWSFRAGRCTSKPVFYFGTLAKQLRQEIF